MLFDPDSSKVLRTQRGQLKRFDGSLTSLAELATVTATVHPEGGEFLDTIFTEIQMYAEQDVILAFPGFNNIPR